LHENTALAIGRDDVAGGAHGAADLVIRSANDRNTGPRVAKRLGAGNVGADVIALHHVAGGTAARDVDAIDQGGLAAAITCDDVSGGRGCPTDGVAGAVVDVNAGVEVVGGAVHY